MTYDGEGHRTRLVETPASGSPTTTDFRYQGDAVTSEVSVTGATTITRTFTTDESGAIVKVAINGDPVSLHNGTYLVTWNGHGDAVALSKIDTTTGALTAANRYTYSTWGMPSTTTHNGFGDLRFRYLYVGQYDVQWDHSTAVPAGLLYMHARHYSPEFGRFLQPDPSALEANYYGYAGNSPVVNIDPEGKSYWKARRGGGGRSFGGGGGKGGGGRGEAGGKTAGGATNVGGKPRSVRTDWWDKQIRIKNSQVRTNGKSGRDKRYYVRDRTHGDIEVFNGKGKPLGSANPRDGRMIKDQVPGRTLGRS